MITKNEKIWAYRNELTWHCRKLPVGLLVVKRASSMREALGSIPGLIKSAKCHQRSATVAMFLWSSVARASAKLRKCAPPFVTCFDVIPLAKI